MPIVCPSITASEPEKYRAQIEKVAHLAHRLHIDLSDGVFAPHKLIDPSGAWWPVGIKADFHLMYEDPFPIVKILLEHQPNMIIVHAEASGNFEVFENYCHRRGVKVGVALLPKTRPESIAEALKKIDHVLIFSGSLGQYGGHADLDLLRKIHLIKDHRPDIEIGWDGGINQQNISQLAAGGVDVFNVGGFIQDAKDPERTFHALQRIADETGTT